MGADEQSLSSMGKREGIGGGMICREHLDRGKSGTAVGAASGMDARRY